jgi:hypothetical protein
MDNDTSQDKVFVETTEEGRQALQMIKAMTPKSHMYKLSAKLFIEELKRLQNKPG